MCLVSIRTLIAVHVAVSCIASLSVLVLLNLIRISLNCVVFLAWTYTEFLCASYLARISYYYLIKIIHRRNYLFSIPTRKIAVYYSLLPGPLLILLFLRTTPELREAYELLFDKIYNLAPVLFVAYGILIPFRVLRMIEYLRSAATSSSNSAVNSQQPQTQAGLYLRSLSQYLTSSNDLAVYMLDVYLFVINLGLSGLTIGVSLVFLLGLFAPFVYLGVRLTQYDPQAAQSLLIAASIFGVAGATLLGPGVQTLVSSLN